MSEGGEVACSRLARWARHPVLHLAVLTALSAWQLVISWRRWPDPVVDFGRELYIPWRLADGALLYRDVEDFYGPLSQYFNAAVFGLFGPALMTLVMANLVVFAAIVILLYGLVRRAWGPWAALVSSAVFVTVFGFSRFLYVGNFNYATPYAHETTHGVLVLLALAAVLMSWVRGPTLRLSLAAGLLGGLALVLKPEIILAAGALAATAVVLHYWDRRRWPLRELALGGMAAMVPTIAFVAFFWRHVGFSEACSFANRAWLNVLGTTDYIAEPAQLKYSGLNTPWINLGEHFAATALVLAGATLIAGAIWLLDRLAGRRGAWVAAVALVTVSFLGARWIAADLWFEAGRCLLGGVLAYLAVAIVRLFRGGEIPAKRWVDAAPRILLAVLGAALMARMVLAGKIYQFGYYQAAFAATVLVAVLIGEIPERCGRSALARISGKLCAFVVLFAGVTKLGLKSYDAHFLVHSPMGSGADQFYTFKASEPLGTIAAALQRQPPGKTLMVLPEGLMLNYLARMPSPVPHFFFYSAVTERGKEARLVERLGQTPPDFVAIIPRDLREYGIQLYGERSGAGREILEWMRGRYELIGWLREGDPEPEPEVNQVEYRERYWQLFKRK